jgi:hypothetical protein
MPWVVKLPKRSDFCGQPPCGLCFAWVDPITAEQTDGVKKNAQDLTQKKRVTKKELAAVRKGLKAAHALKKEIAKRPQPDQAQLLAEFAQAQAIRDESAFLRRAHAKAKARQVTASVVTVLLDNIEMPEEPQVVKKTKQIAVMNGLRIEQVVMSDGSMRWIGPQGQMFNAEGQPIGG